MLENILDLIDRSGAGESRLIVDTQHYVVRNVYAVSDDVLRCKNQKQAEKGFVKYKANAYVRKNKIDVLEYIDLQKERYGSKTFTVNYALMPLYVPHDYLVTGFGDRLGRLICDTDIWWDYANEAISQISFQNVIDAIEQFVLPWFEKYENEETLKKKLLEDKKKSEQTVRGIPYKNAEWLSALEERGDRTEIILENIEKMKLPKKIK